MALRDGARCARATGALLLLSTMISPAGAAAAAPDLASGLEEAMTSAEAALKDNEPEVAEIRYTSALRDGWLILGALDLAEAQPRAAQEAFRDAVGLDGADARAIQALASVDISLGETDEAVEILTRLVQTDPKEAPIRRLLAQALVRAGDTQRAVAVLEQARAAAPEDLELAYDLATGYLHLENAAAAEPLFRQILKERPIAQTHVLIGRACRDAGDYERARAELREALRLDPGARHAHYYLGTILVTEWQGGAPLEEAIKEFRAELKLAPEDTLANVQLGMALVELRRPEEALSPLELAAHVERPESRAWYYLGRCQLALGHPEEATAALQRALALAPGEGAGLANLGSIENVLAQALRRLGREADAAPHFAEAERLAARGVAAARAQYQAAAAPGHERPPAAPLVEAAPLAQLPGAEREAIRRRVVAAMARAYFNVGVVKAQSEHLDDAADFFEKAAHLDGRLPQVQYSLGATRFKLKQFDKALEPLGEALKEAPADATLRRMLSLAAFNLKDYSRAAELLKDDAGLESDPSLLFTYGLSLVHTGRGQEAEVVFARLFHRYGDSAELNSTLGQAEAEQGDFEAAIKSFSRALEISPEAAGPNGALGAIYLEQGRLAEAETALRAELRVRPGDLHSKQNLAVVLEAQQRPEEAVPLLRSILRSKSPPVDAYYLLGKILLAQGDTSGALEELEAGVRLAPENANIHYQLARAYQKQGQGDRARKEFDAFRALEARKAPPDGGR
jgi:tetratricopeptide (TPR) repeat protein